MGEPNELPDPNELANALDATVDGDLLGFAGPLTEGHRMTRALARCLREAEVSVVGGTPQHPKLLLTIPLDRWNEVPSPHDTR